MNFGYVANVARVNAMTVASLAMAPATPANARAARQGRNITEGSTSGGQAWTLSWDASPGAVGYELLVRLTTEPTWSKVIPLGNITRCTLRRQLDDEWSAVRAIGANGSRSMAASMPTPNAPRPATRTRPVVDAGPAARRRAGAGRWSRSRRAAATSAAAVRRVTRASAVGFGVDVFSRRLTPRHVKTVVRSRG